MRRRETGFIWGVLLILAGVLALLQTLNIATSAWSILWAVVFAAAGLMFLWLFVRDTVQTWWAVIPGFTLLALGVLVALSIAGVGDNGWLGAFFLAAIASSFAVVYIAHREFWWAIIPAGVLFTVAVVALVSTWVPGTPGGAVMFFGLALTFGAVSIVPGRPGGALWALIPAAVFVVMGLMVLLSYTGAVNYIWALALIGAGVWLLLRQRGGGEIARHG